MDIFTVWVFALSELGIFILGFILGGPFWKRQAFRDAKANPRYGDMI